MSDPHTPHPLDEALRRQLGHYGEAPSPRVWAGVRRNLPGAPAPRPRGRRRLLLVLLALPPLLAGTWLLFGRLAPSLKESKMKSVVAAVGARSQRADNLTKVPRREGSTPRQPGHLLSQQATLPPLERRTPAEAAPGKPAPAAERTALTGRAGLAQGSVAADQPPSPSSQPARTVRGAAAPGAGSQRPQPDAPALAALTSHAAGTPGRTIPPRAAESAVKPGRLSGANPAATAHNQPDQAPAATSANLIAGVRSGSRRRPARAVAAASEPETSAADAGSASHAAPLPLLPLPPLPSAMVVSPPLPAALAVRPDSAAPAVRTPVRRWAVQAVAGPTLSYRRLRQPAGSSPAATVAERERPALGWGVQVQGRRALSGRWALAAGVGLQQYATRLDQPAASSAPASFSVGQLNPIRDTYNLLVVPVQLSYALGGPGPRWQVAALGGVEPGAYLGGRHTVATTGFPNAPAANSLADFSFSQQTYSDADASPYRAWNLGVSLGLDLRYRLAPAARWQLLAQPTGRYVVSPFARAGAADYSRRPFSLGVLAGLSWDVK